MPPPNKLIIIIIIVTFRNFAGQQWNCCESGYFQPRRPILCQHAVSASLNWIQPCSPCLSLSCLSRMQLQALASCQAPPPTLCACALYACSYSAAIRAYFLPNSLHSNVRKYTSHLSSPCMQSTYWHLNYWEWQQQCENQRKWLEVVLLIGPTS